MTITATVQQELTNIKSRVDQHRAAAAETDPIKKLFFERGIPETNPLQQRYAEHLDSQSRVQALDARSQACAEALFTARATGNSLVAPLGNVTVATDFPDEAVAARLVALEKQCALLETLHKRLIAAYDQSRAAAGESERIWQDWRRDWFRLLYSLTGERRFVTSFTVTPLGGQAWTPPGWDRRTELTQQLARLEGSS